MTRREELAALATQLAGAHYECEDCWYSCPLSTEGCCNEYQGMECTCGVDGRRDKILDAILQVEQDCWDRLITQLGWLIQHTASSGPDDPRSSATVATYRSLHEWARKQKDSL